MAQISKKFISFLVVLAMLFTVAFASERRLVPGGHTTGIKLFSDGVVVVRTVPVDTEKGSSHPAKTAGLKEGDLILKINGKAVDTNEELKAEVEKCKGIAAEIVYRRGDDTKTVRVTPEKSKDGTHQLGLWVRDSMAGIGTVTFIDPQSGEFGALGHGICDVETNFLIPMRAGSVMESKVKAVHKGAAGSPGELVGDYELREDSGVIRKNTDQGIFGVFTKDCDWMKREALPIAEKHEVELGSATILSNVDGNDVREYQIKITQIYEEKEENGKSMMIRITDPKLIEKTGGIVQGMSGSPIIQNGKLIGAVTHVLINDPLVGYGIFIENMLDVAS